MLLLLQITPIIWRHRVLHTSYEKLIQKCHAVTHISRNLYLDRIKCSRNKNGDSSDGCIRAIIAITLYTLYTLAYCAALFVNILGWKQE